MERKKMTKALIGESLKVLMRNHPFEKITIKMITDEAGVIRPTFYNYFCDKYEVVEWIFNEYIIEKVRAMFEQKMYTEGLKLLFVCMKNDCAFYRKAFEITGQNAFTDIIRNSLHNLFLSEMSEIYIENQTNNPLVTAELVAAFYANSLSNLLQMWIQSNNQIAYVVAFRQKSFKLLQLLYCSPCLKGRKPAYLFLCKHSLYFYYCMTFR